jgi:hypothetical protein
MKRALATTFFGAFSVSLPAFLGAQIKSDAPPPSQPAAVQADVPVKQVVLFSSGVGYFEHFGTVRGDGTTELRFKTDQINDVLKSLVLQDLDHGKVSTVSYPSQEPIGKTLKSFQVDITANPTLADLLNQLRGARIDVTLKDGTAAGTIVGVEPREKPTGDKGASIISWMLNLKVGSRFRSIALEEIRDFALQDPKLEEEMDKALAALAGARDQEKKPVDISFKGQGERRVRIGYVVETPVWKTSYRLVLTDAADKSGKHPTTRPVSDSQASSDDRADRNARPPAPEDWARVETTMQHRVDQRNELVQRIDSLESQLGVQHPLVVRAKQDLETLNQAISVLAGSLNSRYRIQWHANDTGGILIQRDAKDIPPAGVKNPDPGGKLQGWAIVENQTDNDWNDVQLSLVSGRPISFIQDLYHPLYIPRPVVFPSLYASLRPQTYQGGISEDDEKKLKEQKVQEKLDRDEGRPGGGGGGAFGGQPGRRSRGAGGGLFGSEETKGQQPEPIDPTASVLTEASTAQLGELFEYTVGSVSLARQKSAMIPIVTDDVEVEKLSIFNENVLTTHPLNGARVRNTTTKHLLQGPVTVFEAGGYAGDARIDDVPPGQQRFISYGIDLNIIADANADSDPVTTETIHELKVVKGVMEITSKDQTVRTYEFQNKSDDGRTIIVEQPREVGERLVEPASAEETTLAAYRLRLKVNAHATAKLNVKTESDSHNQVEILPANTEALLAYTTDGHVPQEVRKALEEVIRLKSQLSDVAQQVEAHKKEIAAVSTEQTRIRENLKTVAPNTDYYNRLVRKLDEQESRIELAQAETADLSKKQESSKKALEDYVEKLNLE